MLVRHFIKTLLTKKIKTNVILQVEKEFHSKAFREIQRVLKFKVILFRIFHSISTKNFPVNLHRVQTITNPFFGLKLTD